MCIRDRSKGKYESNVILASELHAIAQQSIEEQPVILDNEPVKIRDTRIGEFIEQELHGVLSEEEAKKIIATIIRMYPNKTITEYKQLFSQLVVEMMQRIRGDEQ
jgi:Glu-tRNA(Gln) amidotransferase subunit E-like FAD-binding protein